MQFDIIIVGAGLVGASLVCALKNQGFKIALIDKTNAPAFDYQNRDARALALSYTSLQFLKALNVWEKISAVAEPIRAVHVSKQNHLGVTRISAEVLGLEKNEALGVVMNADLLNQILNDTVESISDVEIFRPEEIIQLEKKEDLWQIQLSSKKILSAKLLVGADGSESGVRKHQGIGVKTIDHQQIALVTNIGLNQSHLGVAFERFTKQGSIAMLPFGENGVKCVWVMPANRTEVLESLSEEALLTKVQKEFGYRLGRLVQLGKRVYYPLRTISAETVYGDRLVLIGNAANTLHPVAAQGFNLGLRDAAALAEILVAAKETRKDIGLVEIVRNYANSRKADHAQILEFTARLTEPNVLQWFGILALESGLPFKRWIAERGLGKQQNLPKLCRGVPLATGEDH